MKLSSTDLAELRHTAILLKHHEQLQKNLENKITTILEKYGVSDGDVDLNTGEIHVTGNRDNFNEAG